MSANHNHGKEQELKQNKKRKKEKEGESLPLPAPPRNINCKNPKTENGDRSQERDLNQIETGRVKVHEVFSFHT